MNFSTCLNRKSPAARRAPSRSYVMWYQRLYRCARASIKSVDTDGIVNTIREPKILTTVRTTNADKGLQKTPPRVPPPSLTPRCFPILLPRKDQALAHVYAHAHIHINASPDRETPRRCFIVLRAGLGRFSSYNGNGFRRRGDRKI